MKCPRSQDLDLLAMDALADERAAALLAHARECPACRAVYAAARRDHVDRMRMYEAFDRAHDDLRAQLLAALPDEAPRRSALDPLVRGWCRLGDYAMSLSKTTGRRAAALLVPAAAGLVIAFLLVAPNQKSAFAAAMEHLRQARSFVCRLAMPDGVEVQGVQIRPEGTLQFSDQFGSHCELRMNDVVVSEQFTPVQGPTTIIQPATKTWMVLDASQLGLIDLGAQSPAAFVSALRKLTDDGATELHQETIDGHAAVGYRIPGEKLGIPAPRKPDTEPAYAEVWVDIQNRLPARLLVNLPLPNTGKRLTMVADRFEWDVPLEPSLFQVNIPADYAQVDTQLAAPSEDALLNALQRIAYWTGAYPPTLGPASVLGRLHTMIPENRRAEFDELGRAGIMRLGIEIAGGTMYYMGLVRDGRRPEYFGDEVTPADGDQVLLRWRLDDGHVRVVYGDLHVETLAAEK
jgi:hypothetical protein